MALFGAIALIVAVFGLGALVIGLLLALTPLLTAWGAMAVVAGGLFAVAVILILIAKARWTRTLSAISDDEVRP